MGTCEVQRLSFTPVCVSNRTKIGVSNRTWEFALHSFGTTCVYARLPMIKSNAKLNALSCVMNHAFLCARVSGEVHIICHSVSMYLVAV